MEIYADSEILFGEYGAENVFLMSFTNNRFLGVIVCDPDMCILLANPGATRMFDATVLDEVRGRREESGLCEMERNAKCRM